MNAQEYRISLIYLKNYVIRTNFSICKLVSVTSDEAPAMIGNKTAFDALCKGDDHIPNILKYLWKI